MGKAQSKSVNITTEPTKEIQEGSGELKKLDDSHFKETDSSDKENKVVNDAAENEKNEVAKVEEAIPEETPAPVPEIEDNKVEAPSTDDKATEEIKEATPEPDSAAKPKKEKVKKKWSFRSISFGKKDKQKPSKKDKKNEENKAVAESAEEKLGEDVEGKPVETVDEKPQEAETKTSEAVETRPLEPVVESVAEVVKDEVKPKEEVKPAAAPAIVPEPVAVIAEPVKEKTPEPVVEETKVEEPVVVEEIIKPAEPEPVTPASTPVEEKPQEIPEPVAQPIVEDPPAIPASPPPSQFSVFAESMNTVTTEETLPTPAEVVEVVAEVNGQDIDVEPLAAEMVEKVLEEAVDHVEAEINEKADEEDLPPPPAEEVVETPPATEVVVEVTQNGVGEHVDEPVKLENGVHNGDVINESEPIVEELKKEDKVSDKIAQDSALAPEIITE